MAIYGHNLYFFAGKFYDAADGAKTIADLTAGTADATDFGVELESGFLSQGTALTSLEKFRIVQRNADGSIKATPILTVENIRKGAVVENGSTNAVAEAEQNSNIGYTDVNTGNSIQAIHSNRYTLRLQFTNDTELYSEQKDQYFFEYVSDADAKQIEIADAIAQKMCKMKFADGSTVGANRAKIAVRRYSACATSNEVNTSGSSTLAWTRGSDQVIASAAHGVTAGMYLRQTSGLGVPVYKVKAVNGNTITLDTPSQDSGAATADSKYITAANVEAAAAGIKLVGLAAYHKVGLYPYTKVAFDFQLDGWGDTTSDTSTAPSKGNNVGEAVSDIEWFAMSQNSPGGASFIGTGFPSAEQYAETRITSDDVDYDLITMDFVYPATDSNAIAAGGPIKGTIVVAFTDNSDDSHQDDFETIFTNVAGISGSELAAG